MMEDRLPGLPNGWVRTILGDLLMQISNGITQRQDKTGNGIPVTRIETISNGTIDLNRVGYLKGLSQETIEKYKLFSGDILFSHINSDLHLGKTAVFNSDNIILLHGMNLLLIRVYKDFVSPDWLNYLFNHYRFSGLFISIAQHAVNQSSINQSKLKNLPVLLPPPPEQQRIVARIEELFTRLDAGVEALKKVRAQLKAYRQAVLKHAFEGRLTAQWRDAHKGEMEPASALLERIKEERKKNTKGKFKEFPPLDTSAFPQLPEGWVWTRVGDISLLVTKGSTPTSYGFNYNSSGINFIKVENLMDGRVDRSSLSEFITKDTHEFLKRSQLSPNDVLFSIAGTIGRVAIVQHEDLPTNTNQAIALIRCPWQFIGPKYIKNVLGSTIARSSIEKRPRGIGMNNVSLGDVNNIVFPLPLLPEQHRIVEEIERRLSIAEATEKIIDQSSKQSERLRQSILKRAFEGKLVPQDPSDEPAEKLLERIKEEKAKEINLRGKKSRGGD